VRTWNTGTKLCRGEKNNFTGGSLYINCFHLVLGPMLRLPVDCVIFDLSSESWFSTLFFHP
jgi:hypothetical protein